MKRILQGIFIWLMGLIAGYVMIAFGHWAPTPDQWSGGGTALWFMVCLLSSAAGIGFIIRYKVYD